MNRKKILLGLGLVFSTLTGCVTLTSNKSNDYVLASCVQCVADFQATPTTRLLNLKINSDDPTIKLGYTLTSKEYSKVGFTYLPSGNFDGIVRIPKDTTIYVTGVTDSDFNKIIGSKLVKQNENSAVIDLKTVPLLDELKVDYKALNKAQRKEVVKIISAFDIALNSPNMLFSSKLAEAKGDFNSFLIDMPDSFQNTELYNALRSLKFTMELLDISVDSTNVRRASNKIKLLKNATS